MSSDQNTNGAHTAANMPGGMQPSAILINNNQPSPANNPAVGGATYILNPSSSNSVVGNVTNPVGQHQTQMPMPSQNLVQTGQPRPMINTSQMNPMIAQPSMMTQQQMTHHQQHHQQQQQQPQQQPFQPSQQPPSPMVKNENSNGSFSVASPKLNGNQNNKNITNHTDKDKPVNQKPQVRTPVPVVPLDRQRLQQLVQEVDPNEQLEEEVEDVLLALADDFIDSLVSQACMLAKHRKSSHLDVKDVQLALDLNWNMWIPGFGVDGVVGVYSGTAPGGAGSGQGQQSQSSSAGTMMNRAPKKCLITEAHKQRLALMKKVMKKF